MPGTRLRVKAPLGASLGRQVSSLGPFPYQTPAEIQGTTGIGQVVCVAPAAWGALLGGGGIPAAPLSVRLQEQARQLLGPRLPRPPVPAPGPCGWGAGSRAPSELRKNSGVFQPRARDIKCVPRAEDRPDGALGLRVVHSRSPWRQGKAGGDSGRLPASGSDSEPGCAARKRTGRRGSTGSVKNNGRPRPQGARSLPEVWVQLRELWAPDVKRGQPPRRGRRGLTSPALAE